MAVVINQDLSVVLERGRSRVWPLFLFYGKWREGQVVVVVSWHHYCFINGMMNKQHAITMPKPWPHTGLFGLHLHDVIAKLRKSMEIPTAYQDETGFHFGDEPAK